MHIPDKLASWVLQWSGKVPDPRSEKLQPMRQGNWNVLLHLSVSENITEKGLHMKQKSPELGREKKLFGEYEWQCYVERQGK